VLRAVFVLCFAFAAAPAGAQTAPAPATPDPELVRIQQALARLAADDRRDAAREYYEGWRGLADGFKVVSTVGLTDRTSGFGDPGQHYPIDLDGASVSMASRSASSICEAAMARGSKAVGTSPAPSTSSG